MSTRDLRVDLNIRYLHPHAYDQAVEAYVTRIASNPHVRAVYQIGSIGHPGISDVDLIVVTDRVLDPFWLNNLSVYQGAKDDLTRYIFSHDAYVIDAESFRSLRYIIYADNLVLLAGDEQPHDEPDAEQEKWLSLQLLFDFTALRLAQFQHIYASGAIDARGILLRAGSIKHSYRLLERLGCDVRTVGAFADRVREARDHFEDISQRQVQELFEESFTHFSETARAAADYFVEHVLDYFSDGQSSDILKINKSQILRFSDQASQMNVPGRSPSDVYFPSAAFFHFLAMTRFDNLVGAGARSQLAYSGDEVYELNESYRRVLQRRADSISGHYRFLAGNRVRYAMRGVPGFVIDYHALVNSAPDGTLALPPDDTDPVAVR